MNLNRNFALRVTALLNEKNMSKYKLEKEEDIKDSKPEAEDNTDNI